MVKAIVIREYGGPEVLRWEDVEIRKLYDGEIRVKNLAILLHEGDVLYRKGVEKARAMPFIPGSVAVGEVIAMGNGVVGIQVGDRVGHAQTRLTSAYVEEQVIPANRVLPVPTDIDATVAVSALAVGMAAHYMLHRSFQIQPGITVLIHGADSVLGSLLCQWAHALGATVIGAVSTLKEFIQAKEDGCKHVIILTSEDFVSRVAEITSGNGVNVVYDPFGIFTFQRSLACLKLHGFMVSFGDRSVTPVLIPISALKPKSLCVTSPNLHPQFLTQAEQLIAAKDVFENIASGNLRIRGIHKYALSQAAQAHDDFEKGKKCELVVLIP